jgi:hypothetical protein
VPEPFNVAVPRGTIPFRNAIVPVGTTFPTETNEVVIVAACPAVSELGVIPKVIVAGCATGAVVLPPYSIAPMDGRAKRVSPRMSVTKPGMVMAEPTAGLAELRLKLKLSSTVSEVIV